MIEAQEKWRTLEAKAGKKLLLDDGCLFVFEEDSKWYSDFTSTATPDAKYLSIKDMEQKYPALKLDHNPNLVGIEDKGGNVLAQEALIVFRDESKKLGANLLYDTKVIGMEPTENSIEHIIIQNQEEK